MYTLFIGLYALLCQFYVFGKKAGMRTHFHLMFSQIKCQQVIYLVAKIVNT